MNPTEAVPGLCLEVYKQDRQLTVDDDGCIGQQWSGYLTILAVVNPTKNTTIGIFRDGSDHYIEQRNWLDDPSCCQHPGAKEKQARRRDFLRQRSFDEGTKVYGVKMPLVVNEQKFINVVRYPENMLMLARFEESEGGLTGQVQVWKVALVSQNENIFLTVDEAYNTKAHRKEMGIICFPRLRAHRLLERVLLKHVPEKTALTPMADFASPPVPKMEGVYENRGVVERWYGARNMGCVLTDQGPARVHWSEIPPRPRRRYLMEGELVTFVELRPAHRTPETAWRTVRGPKFKWQVYGVQFG